MNKEETIEFIKKYKNCLYRMAFDIKDFKPEPDWENCIKGLSHQRNLRSELNKVIGTQEYSNFYLLKISYDIENNLTKQILYAVDLIKKTIIDRKEKINTI